MSPTAAPPLGWAVGVETGALIDERFVDGWHEAAASGAAPDMPDEAALSDELALLGSLERTIRWAQAEQYRLVEAARARHARIEGVTDGSGSVEREFAMRSFVAEIATTLVVPEAVAGRLVADASQLTGARSATLDALGAGEISAGHVRAMLEVTVGVPAEVADTLECAALADAATQTTSAFRRRLHRLRERLHPEALDARRARASEQRRVVLEPAPDGMAWLSLFLEAERAFAAMARLDTLADAGNPEGLDARSKAQSRADVAADLLLAGTLEVSDRHRTTASSTRPDGVSPTRPAASSAGPRPPGTSSGPCPNGRSSPRRGRRSRRARRGSEVQLQVTCQRWQPPCFRMNHPGSVGRSPGGSTVRRRFRPG